MTMTLKPKDGFDWSKVNWSAPDAPVSSVCSYCAAEIDEKTVPLRMWGNRGEAAQFCDNCQHQWWGMNPL